MSLRPSSAPLGQERIYVAFADRTWILDAGEHRG
jgi:hypothetical protein